MNLYTAMEHWFPNNSYIDYNLKVVLKHSLFFAERERGELYPVLADHRNKLLRMPSQRSVREMLVLLLCNGLTACI